MLFLEVIKASRALIALEIRVLWQSGGESLIETLSFGLRHLRRIPSLKSATRTARKVAIAPNHSAMVPTSS